MKSDKYCPRCGITKELSEFYKRGGSERGTRSPCKLCAQLRGRKYTRNNKEKCIDRIRKQNRKNQKNGKARRWSREWGQKHPEQVRSRNAVRHALESGEIKKQPCERLSELCYGRMEAHHESYDKPLEVNWFCQYHHGERHREINELERGRL